jgi:hypothetical protein
MYVSGTSKGKNGTLLTIAKCKKEKQVGSLTNGEKNKHY